MVQNLRYAGLGARAAGALIVNYNTETDPKDRSLAYADEDQLEHLIFMDTRVLYKLRAAIIDGHLSVEDAKKILLKKGRVELYSADLGF